MLGILRERRQHAITDKNDLKTQRVRGYFLEAAKQIISSEGVESVSARRIADLAGYSYATIYNYFKDIDELLGETKAFMVTDVARHMRDAMDFAPQSIEDVKRLLAVYVRYHLDHPHIFRFFYFYRLSDREARKEQYDFSVPWGETFRFLVACGSITEDGVESCAKTLIYAVHGLLALFFSGNGLTEDTLFEDLDGITEFILRR